MRLSSNLKKTVRSNIHQNIRLSLESSLRFMLDLQLFDNAERTDDPMGRYIVYSFPTQHMCHISTDPGCPYPWNALETL